MKEILFANLYFKGLHKEDLLKEEPFLKHIVTVNSEFIVNGNNNEEFKEIINENYSTFDGQIPYLLARLKNRKIKFEKLSGSSLIYDFCNMAQKSQKKVFLLGGYEKSNKLAIEKLKNQYMIDIDGFSPVYQEYPFKKDHNQKILEEIKISSPSILFVGFGAVKQELWIHEHKKILEQYGVKWVVGSGGTFEFVAGTIKRAPKFIQSIGLEGIYRLLQEPNFLRIKRIVLSFKIFKYV